MNKCTNCFVEFIDEKDKGNDMCPECEREWVNEVGPKVFQDKRRPKAKKNDPV